MRQLAMSTAAAVAVDADGDHPGRIVVDGGVQQRGQQRTGARCQHHQSCRCAGRHAERLLHRGSLAVVPRAGRSTAEVSSGLEMHLGVVGIEVGRRVGKHRRLAGGGATRAGLGVRGRRLMPPAITTVSAPMAVNHRKMAKPKVLWSIPTPPKLPSCPLPA